MSHAPGDFVVKDGYFICGDETVPPVPDGAHGRVEAIGAYGLLVVDFGELGLRIDLPAELVWPA